MIKITPGLYMKFNYKYKMKKIKTLLVSKVKISKAIIYNFSKLPYTKIVLFYIWEKELTIKLPKNVNIIKYTNLVDFNNKLNEVYKNNLEYKILPYFSWDSNSKYSVRVYNKTYDTKIDPKIFKDKDKMTDALVDIAEKKYSKYTYKNLIIEDYNKLKDELWGKFIIKPTNASSSTNTFKVMNNEDFEDIKLKLAKSYEYVVEEYIWWNLFSIDFFFDWKKMYLLTFVREIAMIDIIEEDKFSNSFSEKYIDELNRHFNFVLPIRYNSEFEKLSKTEFTFLEKIKGKLEEMEYRGFIHLEYKYDKKENKIWFIEWGARLWWSRQKYIKKIYNTDVYRIPYYLQVEKDDSKFIELKNWIYRFKEKEHNINLVWIKTNFVEPVNYIKLLKNTGNILNTSFRDFILMYYKDKFWIKINEINFVIKHLKNYNFYPFYKNNNTRFDYFIELDDENFQLFKKKKFKILEETFFHDYNK